MNGVDLGLLVVIGFFAVNGLRRGFLLGVVDLIALTTAFLVGARMASWIGDPLRGRGIPDALAAIAGFFIASVVCYAVIGVAVRILLSPLGRIGYSNPLAWLNSVLGLIPGAVRGVAIAAAIVTALYAFPPELGLRDELAGSQAAEPLAVAGRNALDFGLTWAGVDPASLGLPSSRSTWRGSGRPLSSVTDVEIDREAERALFDLMNQERADAGLPPLSSDEALTAVGRAHGQEMFRLGYFSHDSPTSGTPIDRLREAGIAYALSAENIALAPSAELAHEGLMNSPHYRANILNPGFTHVGISALRADADRLLVTQEFGG